jgi:hypothetical protein
MMDDDVRYLIYVEEKFIPGFGRNIKGWNQ